ncbi:MAG: ABC transporter substrate-binding protein [Bacteroidetes bacterium]|nr:ABC transporter substrate-binding protein [Bacteroidota bacterium]
MLFKKILIILTAIFTSFSCTRESSIGNNNEIGTAVKLKYAKGFSIINYKTFTKVLVFGSNRNKDTSAVFLLSKTSLKIKNNNALNIIIPVKKVVSLSSIYTFMINELTEINSICAIDNSDYTSNPIILNGIKTSKIAEVAKTPIVEIEKIVSLSPSIVFNYGMPFQGNKHDALLKKANIPVIYSYDHLEETPLARAEWIKFFAAFYSKENLADSIFNSIEKDYNTQKKSLSTTTTKPLVITEIRTGDVWYAPGGKSFMAQLIADAGASYVFKSDSHIGSLNLSFEDVYINAHNANFWLNVSLKKSLNELASDDIRYTTFKAFKNKCVYNNILTLNAAGYSNYWESGILYPNRILSDFIKIFHPELKSNSTFNYYKKLN